MRGSESSRLLLHVFPSLEVGGIQRRFVQVANELKGKYEHCLIALDDNYDALSILPEGANCRKACDVYGSFGIGPLAIAKTLRKIKPDLLITYNWGSIEWVAVGKILNLPQVHHEDGFGPDENYRQLRRRVIARRLLLRGSVKVVVPSLNLRRIALDRWNTPETNLNYLPNGVDLSRFRQAKGKTAFSNLGLPHANIYIGTVAALRREKNLKRLIGAFSRVCMRHDARLLIVGSGSEEAELKAFAQIQGAADRIHFLGQCTKPEAILAELDIFSLSSDTEQMPISVLEAMACGLPIAATDVGDIKAMVSDENREFIVAPDANDLAESLARLSDSESLRCRIGIQNSKRVTTEYSLEEMMRRYDKLYGEARLAQ